MVIKYGMRDFAMTDDLDRTFISLKQFGCEGVVGMKVKRTIDTGK
jgi:hypothetical protein